MEFERCNPVVLISIIGLILIGCIMVYTGESGNVVNLIIGGLIGAAGGVAIPTPSFLKGKKEE